MMMVMHHDEPGYSALWKTVEELIIYLSSLEALSETIQNAHKV